MIPPEPEYEERRAQLAIMIARQRGELASAYRDLAKPLHYVEKGMNGLSFLRNNPWIFAAAPAAFSLISSFFGRKKSRSYREPAEAPPKRSVIGKVVNGGVQLFQLYRRVRPFFP